MTVRDDSDMSSIHEQARLPVDRKTAGPSAPTPRAGMTRSQRGNLQSYRKEFFELVEALVQASALLLADAREQDQERFTKDLEAIHTFGERLRQMGEELFELDSNGDPTLDQ